MLPGQVLTYKDRSKVWFRDLDTGASLSLFFNPDLSILFKRTYLYMSMVHISLFCFVFLTREGLCFNCRCELFQKRCVAF